MHMDARPEFAGNMNTASESRLRAWSTGSEAGYESQSTNITWCLFLIYYFSVCDVFLKYIPLGIAVVLRYLPEGILYLLVLILLWRNLRVRSFPLFWPLAICLATMTCSGILNHSDLIDVLSDFHGFFRFSAFTYLLWRTNITPQRAGQFIDGFFRLTVFELGIGAIELVAGPKVREFFSPGVGWASGQPIPFEYNSLEPGTWLNGTLANYNNYGLFMTMSLVLALSMYSARRAPKYLWLAAACLLAVVLSFSRHSLGLVALGLAGLFWLNRTRLLTGGNRMRFLRLAAMGAIACVIGVTSSSVIRSRLISIVSPDVVQGDPDSNIRLFMSVALTPRFLSSYPFFGQGPVPATEGVPVGSDDRSVGPMLKAAPELPGWLTFYFADVVWVMILGLYGCFGLVGFGLVFWSIARTASYISRNSPDSDVTAVAQSCLVAVAIFIAGGFFSLEMISRDTIPVFWCLSGIVFSIRQRVPLVLRKSS